VRPPPTGALAGAGANPLGGSELYEKIDKRAAGTFVKIYGQPVFAFVK
jgi:hypothetical protein